MILPLHKKGFLLDPNNCRQITLLDACGKVFARSILVKLQEWVEENNILPVEQAGFRSGHSTLDSITAIHLITEKYVKRKRLPVYVAFIDFSTAFYNADRHILWKMLSAMGNPLGLLRLIIIA